MSENKSDLSRYDTILSFLCLEVLALVCFGFAGLTGLTILKTVGFCLSLFLIPFAANSMQGESLNRKGKILFGIVAGLALLSSFSYFWVKMYEGNAFNMFIQNFMVLIGLVGFFLLGYGIKGLKVIKNKYVMYSFLGGLALLTFITLVYSLIRYGFFYSALYKNKVYYFDGVVFRIFDEGKYLDGFSFVEASLYFTKISSFILASSLLALPVAIKHKDKQEIIAISIFGGLGLIDIAIVPFKWGLIMVGVVYFIGAILYLIRYFALKENSRIATIKVVNVLYIVFVALVSLFIFILLLDGALGFEKGFMDKLPLIGKYFKQGSPLGKIREAISSILFSKDEADIRRINFHSFMTTLFGSDNVISLDLRVFEFTILFQNGLLAFIAIFVIAFIYLKMGLNKIMDKEVSASELSLWFSLMGLFIYLSLMNAELPFRHLSEVDNVFSPRNSNFVALTRSNTSLLIYFLLGYLCFGLTSKKERIETNNAKNINTNSKPLSEVNINE